MLFQTLLFKSWRFGRHLPQNWEWVDCPWSVISVKTSWLTEKKLVKTGWQEVWPGVTVHTFVLALADLSCLFDLSGFAVRFLPQHFHLVPVYHMVFSFLSLEIKQEVADHATRVNHVGHESDRKEGWGVKKAGKLGYRRKFWVGAENCKWRRYCE